MLSYGTVEPHTLELLRAFMRQDLFVPMRLAGGTALALPRSHINGCIGNLSRTIFCSVKRFVYLCIMNQTDINMQQKRLYPIGIQTFSEMRTKNYIYIDKTECVYRMTHSESKYMFLSRPGRFGKSLLTSTRKPPL